MLVDVTRHRYSAVVADDADRDAWRRDNLINALRLAAAPRDVQVATLPDFVAIADEVALSVLDAYEVIDTWALSAGARKALAAILRIIRRLPLYSPAMWEVATLDSPPYEELRARAMTMLSEIGAAYEPPRLPGTYVQQR
jgi:hypothetical protein